MKHWLKTFLLLFHFLIVVAVWPHPALAAKDVCLDAAQFERVATQFNFIGFESPADNRCNPSAKIYKTFEALIFIQNIKWGSRLEKSKYNLDLLGNDWMNELKRNIQSIVYIDPQSPWKYVCAKAFAFVEPGKSKIYLCDNFFKDGDVSQLEDKPRGLLPRVGTIMHELWHASNLVDHLECGGLDQGCDHSVGAKGSFALELEVYVKLALSAANLSAEQRSGAHALAFFLASRNFVHPPYEGPSGERGFLIQTDDRKIYFLGDRTGLIEMFTDAGIGRLLRFDRDHLIQIDSKGLRGDILRHKYTFPKVPYIKQIANGFRPFSAPFIDFHDFFRPLKGEKNEIVDLYSSSEDLNQKLVFITSSGDIQLHSYDGKTGLVKKQSLSLPKGEIPQFVRDPGLDDSWTGDGLEILTQSGRRFKISSTSGSKSEALEEISKFPKNSKDQFSIQLEKADGSVELASFQIDQKGNLCRKTSANPRCLAVKAAAHLKFSRFLMTTYYSYSKIPDL